MQHLDKASRKRIVGNPETIQNGDTGSLDMSSRTLKPPVAVLTTSASDHSALEHEAIGATREALIAAFCRLDKSLSY
jgi:hypothetical protein